MWAEHGCQISKQNVQQKSVKQIIQIIHLKFDIKLVEYQIWMKFAPKIDEDV